MNIYVEMKKRQQEEIHALPLHFAFGNKQFEEKCRELNLSEDPKRRSEQIVSISYGGFVLKEDYPKVQETFERHAREREEAINADKTGDGYIFDIRPTPSLRAFHIEYARSGNRSSTQAEKEPAAQQQQEEQLVSPEQLPNFLGFEPLGGSNHRGLYAPCHIAQLCGRCSR